MTIDEVKRIKDEVKRIRDGIVDCSVALNRRGLCDALLALNEAAREYMQEHPCDKGGRCRVGGPALRRALLEAS